MLKEAIDRILSLSEPRKPHVRGDEPHQQELQNIRAMETPQVWGYMQRR